MVDEKQIKKIDDPFELLEKVSEIGKKEKNVKISDELNIVIETLTAEDEGKIFSNTDKFDGTEYFLNHKIETICYATCKINEKSLREYEKIEDDLERERVKKQTIDKLRIIIKKWNDDVVNFVYGKYVELSSESDEDLVKSGILLKLPVEEESSKEETSK